jgi:hypothetical protein
VDAPRLRDDAVDAILIEIEETEQGIEIFDQIQRTRFELHFDGEIGPAETDVVEFPVDTAVRLKTDRVTVPVMVSIWARRAGEHHAVTGMDEGSTTIPAGGHQLQLNISGAPMKIYFVADSSVEVTTTTSETILQTEGCFVLGIRSPHDKPEGTVITDERPRNVMKAVSTFGSALQTTSPDRAWPTLRGHPPRVKFGDELRVPDHIRRPETEVTIEVPPDLASIYLVSSLAYYLGARVVPGTSGAKLCCAGYTEPLGEQAPAHEVVSGILRHLLLLDGVVRTEGIYQTAVGERRALSERVNLDYHELYNLPIAERTAQYLEIDRCLTEQLAPNWPVTTTIGAKIENVDILPYVADELSFVRTPESKEITEPGPQLEGFLRSENDNKVDTVLTSSEVNTPRHQWVGEGLPIHASRPSVKSFERQMKRTPKSDKEIQVAVVCNDEEMIEEVAGSLYSKSTMTELDVTVHEGLTTQELRDVFESENDFVHYIGHGDKEGLQCTDGWLNLGTLSGTGTDAFLLNGCQSFEQGDALVRAGAVGGVVTLSNVGNDHATKLGQELSRLLAYGHSLGVSLHILRRTGLARKFAVVGFDGFCLAQCQAGIPTLYDIEPDGETARLDFRVFQTPQFKTGSVFKPHIDGAGWHLNISAIETFELDVDEHKDFLVEFDTPTIMNGKLDWSRNLFENQGPL